MAVRRITEKLTTTTFVEEVAAELGVTQKDARAAVMAVFEIITRANASGHSVAITNFGTFMAYRTKSRKARNPHTGERMTVASHRRMRFRPSDRLIEAVRTRNRKASIRKLPKGGATK